VWSDNYTSDTELQRSGDSRKRGGTPMSAWFVVALGSPKGQRFVRRFMDFATD